MNRKKIPEKTESNLIPTTSLENSPTTQSSTPTEITVIDANSIEQDGIQLSNFNEAVDVILNSSGKYASTVLLKLVASNMKDTSIQNAKCFENIEKANQRHDDLMSNFIILKEDKARLEAEKMERDKYSPLVRFSMFGGVILFGTGVSQLESGHYGLGWTLTIIGGGFVLLAFFIDRNGG